MYGINIILYPGAIIVKSSITNMLAYIHKAVKAKGQKENLKTPWISSCLFHNLYKTQNKDLF